jgi:hypothetical protein
MPPESPAPPLYSARAISLFAFFFSAIAGGVLLAHNFRAIGRPDAARKALGAVWGLSCSCC